MWVITNHLTKDCDWHYADDTSQKKKVVDVANASYGVDTNWYMDTGATNHITGELEKVTMQEKYRGHDQVYTAANGAGMKISHIGHAYVRTPTRNLHLKNIMHVPKATKNLISAHRLSHDNHAILETHPHYFFVKDKATKKTILKGRCRGGLYPLSSAPLSSGRQAFGATKVSPSRWHSRLGHPSSTIVQHVLRKNKISFSNSELNKESICDACQKGKSHQLPYPNSISVSNAPL